MSKHDETSDPPPSATPTFSQQPDANGTLLTINEQTVAVLPAIPGYELLDKLGSGGMGIVYRAREIAFNRDVAIKILRVRYRAEAISTRRFLEEARVMGQLQHPAIPPIHQIGTLADGRPFLAMKLIKGETLANLLADASASRGMFIAAFAQVCQAIAYAHSRKVIHRDLKPANVMVGAFGEVQVMDWGLAKFLTDSTSPQREQGPDVKDERVEIQTMQSPDLATLAGSVLGTPAYMAPEQAAGEVDKTDERSDVFGLGAILCTILTGKPPYSGTSPETIRLTAIRWESADTLARLDACGADAELIALCKRCLSVEQNARPRDAGEVAKAVAAHLAAVEERAWQTELDRVRAEERRKQRRVRFALTGVVALLLALTGFGAGLVSLWRNAESAKKQLGAEKKLTENAHDEAVRLKADADAGRVEADRLRGVAEKAEAKEIQARKTLEVFEYGRTIQVAHQERRDNNILGAGTLLEGTQPELRGWEWYYVHRLCNGSLLTLKGHTAWVTSASFSVDGSHIVTGSWDNTAKVWDAKTGAEVRTLKGHTNLVSSASFSVDGSRIVTGSRDTTAKVWDAKTGTEMLTLKGHTEWVYSASFSVDGSRIVTGSHDKTAKVWDAKTGTELLTLKGHTEFVTFASFSPDGSRIVTGSRDKTAKVWDAKTGAEVRTLQGHTDFVYSALFSVDGSRIVTGSHDKTAKVWDAKTGAEVRTLQGHTAWVSSASFSPDGSRIVTGSQDNTAKVWDAKTGVEVLPLKGHTEWVTSASFSVDGSRIVTSSRDNTAKVWDAKTGAEMLTLKGHTHLVYSASFSVDGSRIVTGSHDNTAKVWDARPLDREFLLKELASPPRVLSR